MASSGNHLDHHLYHHDKAGTKSPTLNDACSTGGCFDGVRKLSPCSLKRELYWRKAGRRKELLTKTNYEEEPQRRWNAAAFQPRWFCVSVLERAILV